jgi:mono/diheme cytochrome c family protein
MTDPDDKLERAYRALAKEEPPPALDAAILSAARRSVTRPSLARRWGVPVSLAAVIMLAIGVTLEMRHEKPGVEVAAPAAPEALRAAPAPAAPPPAAPAEAPAEAPVAAASAGPAASTPAAPAEPTGPYKFDAARGASLFATNCSACHQATGMGLPGAFPPLKGDPVVLSPDPTKQIETILQGLHGENVGGTVYQTPMPPFAGTLNDADIADIANHERSSWGNQGKPVTADQVKAVRAKEPTQ